MDVLRFDCAMDKTMATTTTMILGFLAVFLVAMVVLFVWIGIRTGWPSHVVRMAVIFCTGLFLVFFAAAFFSYALSPRSVVLTGDTIVVDRILGEIAIPIAEVRNARRVSPEEFAGVIRTMGSDGLFARIGKFHSPTLGNFRMYLTDRAEAVLVDADERFILSPSDSGRFISELLMRRALIAPIPSTGTE